jgi:hypothetical protein
LPSTERGGYPRVKKWKLRSEVGVSLLCRACAAKAALDALNAIVGDTKSDIPTLGFMLLPMHIETKLADMLKGNVTSDLLTDLEN